MLRVEFKLICFSVIAILWPVLLFAQLRYPIVGTYKGKSAQGMAIWKNNAYLMSDGGLCRVLNMKNGKIVKEFNLACSGRNTHVNNACFGLESEKDNIPLLYISEYLIPYRCFVEQLNESGSTLLQTIEAYKDGKLFPVHDWVTDRDNKFLYGITCSWKHLDDLGNVKITITKFRMPQLKEGKHVVLENKEFLDSFDVIFANGVQGAKIRKGHLYIATGLQELDSHAKDSKRAIIDVDLYKKIIARTIDLTSVTMNEPEDIDFYRNKCFLYCGQNGGIYEVRLK